METGINVPRQKIASEHELKQEKSTKSFKTTRKKERSSNLYNLLSKNQMPSNENGHHFLRKNDKTETVDEKETETLLIPKETSFVKETKTSRLRASNRLPLSSSVSLLSKSPKTEKTIRNTYSSTPVTNDSFNYNPVDKSISRKSYLNRCHTCEAVHDSNSCFRESSIKRQRLKNSDSELIKKNDETHETILTSSDEKNIEGHIKESNSTSQLVRKEYGSPEEFNNPVEKNVAKSSLKIIKLKQPDNKNTLKNVKSEASPKFSIDYSEKKLRNSNIDKVRIHVSCKGLDSIANAESLAASTLKVVNRLDEINNKSRNIFTNVKDKEVSKNNVQLHSMKNKNYLNGDCIKIRNKISSSNCTSSHSNKNLSLKTSHNFQKRLILSNETENSDKRNNNKNEIDKSKLSILKHTYECQNFQVSNRKKSKPLSILKKKSFFQDENCSNSSPVTFSLSGSKEDTDYKIHGILKKRLSLDENEVLRRRSYSPEDKIFDFKSILKNQRRSSMIELSIRSQSPDFTLQGILKQKLSKEDKTRDFTGTQGILKKKLATYLNSPQAIDISSNSLENVNNFSEIKICKSEDTDFVRPILKKKIFFEEHNSFELNFNEAPKSILKKKKNVEPDQSEEMPKKPILKSCKVSSAEELEVKHSDNPESVKPILKKEDRTFKDYRDNQTDHTDIVHRQNKQKLTGRPLSSPDIEQQLNMLFFKRRSLQLQSNDQNLNLENNKILLSKETLPETPLEIPVFPFKERSNLENSLESLNEKKHKVLSKFTTLNNQNCTNYAQMKPSVGNPVVTPTETRTLKLRENAEESSSNEEFNDEKKSCTSRFTSGDAVYSVYSKDVFVKQKQKFFIEKDDQNLEYSAVGSSCGAKMELSYVSNNVKKQKNEENVKTSDERKAQNEEIILDKKYSKSNIEDSIENSEEKKNTNRFLTQPVSAEELKIVFDKNKNYQEEGKNHEDELSKMTYRDRLKMFEDTFVSQSAALLPKKRSTRFKTQPVTAVEVESAKNKNRFLITEIPKTSLEVNKIGNKKDETYLDKEKDICGNGNPKQNISKAKVLNFVSSCQDTKDDGEKLSSAKKGLISELKNIFNQPFSEIKNTAEKTNEFFYNESCETKSDIKGSNSSSYSLLSQPDFFGNQKKSKEKEDFLCSDLSGKKEAIEHLQNDGKLKMISKSRNNSSMVKSQSHFSVPEVFRSVLKIKSDISFDEVYSDYKTASPSTTQELNAWKNCREEDMRGGTIRERLERLKKSGETDWQKRKSQNVDIEKEISNLETGNFIPQENKLSSSQINCLPSVNDNLQSEDEQLKISSILADRLGKLDAAKDDWKKRVKPPDAIHFSVEGKMLEQSEGLSVINLEKSPSRTSFMERKKRCPKATRFKSKSLTFSLKSVPNSPLQILDNPIVRSASAPGNGEKGLLNLSKTEDFKKISVTVPKIDDETFTSFFKDSSTVSQEHLEINDEDLDVVTEMKSSQLLIYKKNIAIQKRRATTKNPLRALAARLSPQEYIEIQTGSTKKELKKGKIEKVLKNSNLAVETLAGLASQEDFTAINLKKASEGSFNSQDPPYKDLMLLQIKGRRHVQTRLIEPLASNINAGDCFILVTPKNVYHYTGEFSNVIEMSRSAEIALYIQQKGDLGCTTDSVITIGKNGKATNDQIMEFWKLLEGNPKCEKGAGNPDEDELFESSLNDTNMIYEVVGDELVPNELFWGCSPKIEILDPNKILIFDFGSEFYVWNGKNVNLEKRKFAMKLAKEFWEEGFDYSGCDLCPLVAASYLGNQNCCFQIPETSKVGTVRPPWSLFAKITQNMETVLFKEKFQDWPDFSRIGNKCKNYAENNQKEENGTIELKACDAKAMIENELPEQDLVLEGSHLGRGLSYFDEETKRCSKIITHNIRVWHISDYEYSEVSHESIGQFYMKDSFIVRWHYVVTSTGRELNGQPSKYSTTGRDRYAYFFWQGCDSHINDKGTAACLTIELDKEKGPQIRVDQGLEPPAFLNLFQGRMIVHQGKYMSKICKRWRLYICRGETATESTLLEVPCSMRHLRSAASFILINNEQNLIIVWHGFKTLEHTKKVAMSAANLIQINTPKDFSFSSKDIRLREENEGEESEDFLEAVGGDNKQLYFSLVENNNYVVQTPRLFHFTSLYGNFISTEITSSYLNKSLKTPFPFVQNDLYSASQPALFMMDTSLGLWLWQGWWVADSKNDGSSGNVRFQAERRAALNTVMMYWKLKYSTEPPKAYLIWAGLEPLAFTNQFPFWNDRDDIADINLREGKKFGEMIAVEEELANLTKSTYSLSQLQNRPLPDGVNPSSLEDYLQPHYFQEVFGVEKEEFFKMPTWKKKKFKQEAGLF